MSINKNVDLPRVQVSRNRWHFATLYITSVVLIIHPTLYRFGVGTSGLIGKIYDTLVQYLVSGSMSSSAIGMAGSLPTSLYLRQIAICLLGTLFMLAYTLSSILMNKIPLSTGYEKNEIRMMEKHNWNRLQAILAIRLILITCVAPMSVLFGWFLMNAKYGWVVFNINDTISLITFSIFFVFLPGYIAVALSIAVIEYLLRDLVFIVKWLSCEMRR